MNIIKKYYFLIKKNIFSIIKWFIISVLSVIGTILLPYILGQYLDILIEKRETDIYFYTGLFLLASIFSVIFMYLQNMIYVKTVNKIIYQLKIKIFDNIYKIPVNDINKSDSSYITRRVDMDSNLIVNFIFDFFNSVVINIVKFIILLVIIFTLNIKIFFVMIATFPLYVLLYYLFKKPLYEKGYDFNEKNNEFFSIQNEQITFIKSIKINQIQKYFKLKMNNHFNVFFSSLTTYYKTSASYSSLSSFSRNFSILLMLFFGGFEIIRGNLTVGEFTIINNYYGVLIGVILLWLEFGKSYQEAKVADSRIDEYFKYEKEKNGEEKLENINSITINNLKVCYEDENYLFDIPLIRFKKGNVYNIIGDNGTGKSTLVDILTGINQKYIGEVYFNHTNIKDIDMIYTRKEKIGVVEQFSVFFNDTMKDNILFDKKYDVDNMKDFSQEFLDLSFIENHLNFSEENIINKNLSGGEKQKIGILRMMIKNPEVLILDEPTASLDKQSKLKIKKYLNKIKSDKIIIIISHDNSIEQISDEIIDLNSFSLNKNSLHSLVN